MSPIFLYLQLRRIFPPRTAVFRVYYRLVACGLELYTLLHQSGLLLSIRWVWPGTMHSVASAWPSANIRWVWSGAMHTAASAWPSANIRWVWSGAMHSAASAWPSANIRWVWSGAMHSVPPAWPSTQHQMGLALSYALCCISLAFYSASDGCGLEL
jgi:hypothetical protein